MNITIKPFKTYWLGEQYRWTFFPITYKEKQYVVDIYSIDIFDHFNSSAKVLVSRCRIFEYGEKNKLIKEISYIDSICHQ